MILSEEVKQKIADEFNQWRDVQYSSLTLEERQVLGAFYTPSELTIQMIEKFDNLDGSIIDPCAGAGGLLSASIIAGADPKNVYAIELSPIIVEVLKKRLCPLGVPEENIYCGSALDEWSYDFPNHLEGKPLIEVSLF